MKYYNIDPARVYANGYSGGGETMSRVLGKRPELFTAYLHCSSQWDGDLATKHQADRIWQTFLNDPLNFDGSEIDAENYFELATRVKRALTQIAKRYPKGNVLVTAHALVITFGVKYLLGKDLNTIRREGLVANTSVTVLEVKDKATFELLKWNDTTHLK